jgi:hypothetical protein
MVLTGGGGNGDILAGYRCGDSRSVEDGTEGGLSNTVRDSGLKGTAVGSAV